MVAVLPFAKLDDIMRVIKENLEGKIPDMLRQKNKMIFMDYLAGGQSNKIAGERQANAMSNGAVNASFSIDRRPQVIIQLERDLAQGLKENDIRLGDGGVYHFNLNQVAYIIERDVTDVKRTSARERVSRILLQYNIEHAMVRVSGGGNFIV